MRKNQFQPLCVRTGIFFSLFLIFSLKTLSSAYAFDYANEVYDGYPTMPGGDKPLSLAYILFLVICIGGFLFYLHNKNRTYDHNIKEKDLNDKLNEINIKLENLANSKEAKKEEEVVLQNKPNNLEKSSSIHQPDLPKVHQVYKSKLLDELKLNPYEILGVDKGVSLIRLRDIHITSMTTFNKARSKNPDNYEALDEFRRRSEAYYVLRSERDATFNLPEIRKRNTNSDYTYI